tara:strand:+ start:32 stop:964 length:933 start_codon:yes stop_codon:yes gene_type:complete
VNYIVKALLQNTLSILPHKMGNKIYYLIQKKFGSLKKLNHKKRLFISNKIFELAQNVNCETRNKRFLEIGTGRNILLPLGLWLKGASEVVTVDLNRYFDDKVFIQSLQWIIENKEIIKKNIPDIDNKRISLIESFIYQSENDVYDFLEKINISYIAPCDASKLPYKDNYFDFHISYTVLEHINVNSLFYIFKEAKRVINEKGCLIHLIDYTDHFSHSDPNLSKISFLSYSERKIDFLINNKYMYMNLLRHDDFIDFFEKNLFDIIYEENTIDENLLERLNKDKNQFNLREKYFKKNNEILATASSWFILR